MLIKNLMMMITVDLNSIKAFLMFRLPVQLYKKSYCTTPILGIGSIGSVSKMLKFCIKVFVASALAGCDIGIRSLVSVYPSVHSQSTLTQAFNPIALRKAKIVYNFGLSECSRVKAIQKI